MNVKFKVFLSQIGVARLLMIKAECIFTQIYYHETDQTINPGALHTVRHIYDNNRIGAHAQWFMFFPAHTFRTRTGKPPAILAIYKYY